MTIDRLQTVLRQVFGFESFRPYQKEIIQAIMEGRDVFAVMPTGGGKSLCYQLPSVLLDGVCVVVSPLLSLMKDQVDSARELGIRAASLNSTSSTSEFIDITNALVTGKLDLLYISPERYNSSGFVPWLRQGKVALFAVDEAHCISQWGHYFRTDYLGLTNIISDFPDVPLAAFTATATEEVTLDIVNQLRLRTPLYIRASFDRPNLYYQILYKENPKDQLLTFLKGIPCESGIVYCGSRKKVDETANMLSQHGFNAKAYHAGMPDQERAAVQEAFANDEIRIIVATIAFGMGIDKSNVRFVVHADLPKNLEGYYQETGRAGRDGSPARCLLLFGYQDIAIQRSFINDYDDPVLKATAERQIQEMLAFAQTDQCRRKNLLLYFGEKCAKEQCGNCDFCTDGIQREDVTIDSQKVLSAMQRTGNRFGANHLIDILVGADTEKIRTFRHHELPTWGVGKNRDKKFWKLLINAIIFKGIATLDPTSEFPVPQVTPLGWEVMRGKEKVELIYFPALSKKREKKTATGNINQPRAKQPATSNADQPLFDLLRIKRMELAKEKGVPPYVIFTDKTLWDMTYIQPKNYDEFRLVSGVGEHKVREYADAFLEVLRQVSFTKRQND